MTTLRTTEIKERHTGGDGSARSLNLNGYPAFQSFKDTSTPPTFIRDALLLIVIEGAMQIHHGNSKHSINANQMALLKRDILVARTADTSSAYSNHTRYLTIRLSTELLREFAGLAQLSIETPEDASPVTIASLNIRLLRYVDSLEPYFVAPEGVAEYLIKIKLLELLFNLAQTEHSIMQQLLDLRPQYRTDITETVEQNIMNAISLPQLAVLSGRSLSSFKRDFTAIYNMPPSTWFRLRRLEKARELIQSTTMTVTDICYTLGFENLAHFSRLFKSRFGQSPSKLRHKAEVLTTL